MSTLERLLKYIQKTDTCWLWTGFINEHGYGKFSVQNKPKRAHRVSYELHVGPIPAGLDLDHLCRVRKCVNPKHLEPVTRAENLRRSPTACFAGGVTTAKLKRAQTHCKNGHAFTVENTGSRNGFRYCKTCNRASANRAYRGRRDLQ